MCPFSCWCSWTLIGSCNFHDPLSLCRHLAGTTGLFDWMVNYMQGSCKAGHMVAEQIYPTSTLLTSTVCLPSKLPDLIDSAVVEKDTNAHGCWQIRFTKGIINNPTHLNRLSGRYTSHHRLMMSA